MRILGLVPARGGSKGVPRKNIRVLNGKPLLAYTAENALKSKLLTRVVLSTEDQEIAEIGKNCGLDVPFLRPAELAQDTTPSLSVVRHTLQSLEEADEFYEAVCLLQPTNPLRRAEDIDNCIEVFRRTDADCVISVLPVPHEFHPNWVFAKNESGEMSLFTGEKEPTSRRQDLQPVFFRDGSIYISRRDTIIKQNSLYGKRIQSYEMNPEFSANIDTEQDWKAVEKRINC